LNNPNNNSHQYISEPFLAKFLRWAIYLSAFMPLIIFSQFLSPFHFGKVIVFRLAVEIMAVLYIVLVIRERGYLPPRTKLFWAVTTFTAVYGLTTFTSVSFFQSFWGTLERMGGWYSLLHFWAFFAILTSVMTKKEHWYTLLRLTLIASLTSAFYGFLQKTSWSWIIGSGGRSKIFGTLGNPALFAGYMIVSAFLALTLSQITDLKSWRKFFYLTFGLDSLAVLLAGVRGSVLALVVGLILFGYMYSGELGYSKLKKYVLAFFILVVVIAGTLYAFRNTDFIKSNSYLTRYSDISINSLTVRTRFWAWTAGFQGFTDSVRAFTVGYGPENFNIPFSKHFNPKFFAGPGAETLFDRAHNQFLEVLFTMGILGFAAYIAIFYYAFKNLIKLKKNRSDQKNNLNIFGIGLIATLVAYSIHNSFIFDTSANYLVFFFILGLMNFLSIEKNKTAIRKPNHSGLAYAIGIILAVPAFILMYYTNIMPVKANYAATRAIILNWNKKNDDAFVKFKEALDYEVLGKYEIRHRFAQFVLDQSASGKISDKTKDEMFLAIDYLKKNTIEFPRDYLPYLYLSRIYITLGKSDPTSPYNDLALDNSGKALEISPTFVRTYYEVAQAYLNKKDDKKAIETFKKAIDLNQNVSLTWWYLGITQLDSGDTAGAIQSVKTAIEKGYDVSNESDLLRLLSLFVKAKDIDSTISIYEKLIIANPDNAQYHASLAAAYAQVKKIDQAVEQARTAAGLDATFAPEAKRFVESLGRVW